MRLVRPKGRLDLIITFFQHRYLLELKVWYGDAAPSRSDAGRGGVQLCAGRFGSNEKRAAPGEVQPGRFNLAVLL